MPLLGTTTFSGSLGMDKKQGMKYDPSLGTWRQDAAEFSRMNPVKKTSKPFSEMSWGELYEDYIKRKRREEQQYKNAIGL